MIGNILSVICHKNGVEIAPLPCALQVRSIALAKELGFVVVFGYSDDNAELRGAIDDEIG